MSTARPRGDPLFWLADGRFADEFPPTARALSEPDGLLAAGGELTSARLVDAYRRGIFPWYSAGQPLLWWSPDPRSVLTPTGVRVSRSLAKRGRNAGFQLSFDRAFNDVVDACAGPRRGADGTWITRDMRNAYAALHAEGIAHSVECWDGASLAGGLYGVALGSVFFGESMFTRRSDASKLAFVELCRLLDAWGYGLIDCQIHNAHLARLGAHTVPRDEFERRLSALIDRVPAPHAWQQATSPGGDPD